MRYRPFGAKGATVSAISLRLEDEPRLKAGDWRNLIFAALESGINCFEINGRSPALLDGAAEAFAAVERRLLFVGWRLGANGERALNTEAARLALSQTLDRLGLDYLDLLTLDDPDANPFDASVVAQLERFEGEGLTHRLGVRGSGPRFDAMAATGAFAAISTAFNLSSGWAERNRVRSAVRNELVVIGEDYWPLALHEEKRAFLPKPSLWKRRTDPLAGAGGYEFLTETPGWKADEICLAYALTEPSLATVQITPHSRAEVERLAQIAERDLPTGASAQIEMARFSAQEAEKAARRA